MNRMWNSDFHLCRGISYGWAPEKGRRRRERLRLPPVSGKGKDDLAPCDMTEKDM